MDSKRARFMEHGSATGAPDARSVRALDAATGDVYGSAGGGENSTGGGHHGTQGIIVITYVVNNTMQAYILG